MLGQQLELDATARAAQAAQRRAVQRDWLFRDMRADHSGELNVKGNSGHWHLPKFREITVTLSAKNKLWDRDDRRLVLSAASRPQSAIRGLGM